MMGRVGSRNYRKPEPGSKARDSSEFPVADSKVFSLSVQEKGSISFFHFQRCASSLSISPTPAGDFLLLSTGFGGTAAPLPDSSRAAEGGAVPRPPAGRAGALPAAPSSTAPEACSFIHPPIHPPPPPPRAFPCSREHAAIPAEEQPGPSRPVPSPAGRAQGLLTSCSGDLRPLQQKRSLRGLRGSEMWQCCVFCFEQ